VAEYGSTDGAKRVVADDVSGLPVATNHLPASAHDNKASEAILTELGDWGGDERLALVLVDRGDTAVGARRLAESTGGEARRVGWDESSRCSGRSSSPGGSRSGTGASASLAARASRS
jgi:hypothetical protein